MLRSLLIQNSRNEKLHDGIGFFYTLMPLFKKLSKSRADTEDYTERFLTYYNSNPILSSIIIGAIQNIETRRESGYEVDTERVNRLKETLSSVMTAKGDYLFEVVLFPLTLTIACIFTIYEVYLGPVIFLLLYNYYHIRLRIGGYRRGLSLGEDVGDLIMGPFLRISRVLTAGTAFVAGIFTSIVFIRGYEFGGTPLVGWGILSVAAMILLRRKYSLITGVMIMFLITALILGIWQVR